MPTPFHPCHTLHTLDPSMPHCPHIYTHTFTSYSLDLHRHTTPPASPSPPPHAHTNSVVVCGSGHVWVWAFVPGHRWEFHAPAAPHCTHTHLLHRLCLSTHLCLLRARLPVSVWTDNTTPLTLLAVVTGPFLLAALSSATYAYLPLQFPIAHLPLAFFSPPGRDVVRVLRLLISATLHPLPAYCTTSYYACPIHACTATSLFLPTRRLYRRRCSVSHSLSLTPQLVGVCSSSTARTHTTLHIFLHITAGMGGS